MDNTGLAGEFEQLGMVALIGVLLIPGVIWVAKGKTGGAMVLRTLVIGGAIGAAVAIEATMDRSVEAVVDGAAG